MGSHGITDYDGDWDAQATKYECYSGKHTVFVVESDSIEEPYGAAFRAAEDDIVKALSGALWESKEEATRSTSLYTVSNVVLLPSVTGRGQAFTSLDDLRNELAKRALKAFKDVVAKSTDSNAYDGVEYEYIHAVEDVDEVLDYDEFKDKLKELGWLKRT